MKNVDIIKSGLKKRYRAEKRFKTYGLVGIILSIAFLIFLLFDLTYKSTPAFTSTYIQLEIEFNEDILGANKSSTKDEIFFAPYRLLISQALYKEFPTVKAQGRNMIYAIR
jgi:phosphate transport system permease protein